MSNFLKKYKSSLTVASAVLGYLVFMLSPTGAQELFNSNVLSEESLNNSEEFPLETSHLELSNSISEVPETPVQQIDTLSNSPPPGLNRNRIINVHELQDITPDHWAYEALRNLVEKYRCIGGFPGETFQGNRAMSRYEFAAGLNACLLKIRQTLGSLSNKFADEEDFIAIQRLTEEFATEIEEVTSKIDDLEEQVTFLKEHQFSPTTILRGGVDFNLISAFGDKKAVSPGTESREDLDEIPTFSERVVLIFDTSFTGKDRLRTQLIAGNVSSFGLGVTGTDMTRLIGTTNTGNDIRSGTIFYQMPLGSRGIFAVAPIADFPTRIFPAFNPVNSISNFGAESPIYSFAFGTGAVVYYNFTDKIGGGVSYLTTSGRDASAGLFNGQYTILAQLSYTPTDGLGMALTYARYYAPDPASTIDLTGSKGSVFAQFPFGANTPTSSNALGLQLTYKLTDKLILGGWLSYWNAVAEGSPQITEGVNGSQGSHAEIWSWAITAFLVDWGKLGSQLSIVFGMPPKVTNNDVLDREDPDTSLHFEVSYRYLITDRVSVTPGFLLITNPEHNSDNPAIGIGLVRTRFTF
ncbi:MAG: iron uptake porin [Limnoraphis robusta]|jgi:hypothetical protein